MRSLHHAPSAVKEPRPLSPHPLIAALAAHLRVGAHERCAHCLSWTDIKGVAALALFTPHYGGQQVAYCLCKRCARLTRGTPDQQQELTRRVEQYLIGGAP